MKTLRIRNVVLGEGMPKICVSIIEKTKEAVLAEANNLKAVNLDIVEWRADYFDEVQSLNNVVEVLRELRNILEEIPILFTFRTKKEGGEKEISTEEYKNLNIEISKTGLADLVDVELFKGDEIVKEIIEKSHENSTKIIASNHDFLKTPLKEELIARLVKMQELGADISKIAVMPNSKADVLVLLQATEEMNRLYATKPIITMAMSNIGVISRLTGEFFGSAVTFGCVSKVSASGQVEVNQLKRVLKMIHKSVETE